MRPCMSVIAVQCFGTFAGKEAAARAYDVGSIHIYGEEAVLNFSIFDYWDFDKKKLKSDLPWEMPKAAEVAGSRPQKKRKKTTKSERVKQQKSD